MARRRGSGYDRLSDMDDRYKTKMKLLASAGIVNPTVAEMAISGFEKAVNDLRVAQDRVRKLAKEMGVKNVDIPKYVQVCMNAWKRFRRGEQLEEYWPIVEGMARAKGIDLDKVARILVMLGIPVPAKYIAPAGGRPAPGGRGLVETILG